jgi:tetratricopeptide (TPR) repeat protein
MDVARALVELSPLLERLQHMDEAEAALKESLSIMQLRLGRESLQAAASMNNLAAFYERRDRLADAEAMLRQALRIKELKLGHESTEAAVIRNSLADLHPPPLSDIDTP